MSDRFRGTPAHDPADLSAVFVSDGAEDTVGVAALVGGVGAGALRFPAVLVPEGTAPPGYPFVEFGEMHGDGEPGSSHRHPATQPGLYAHRSSTHAGSQTRPPGREPRASPHLAFSRQVQAMRQDWVGLLGARQPWRVIRKGDCVTMQPTR